MAAPYLDTYWFPNGALASFVQARVFPRNSNNLAVLWQDAGQTIPQVNPVSTTVGGVLAFFATPGDYWIHIGFESFAVSIDDDGIVEDVWPETFQHVQSVPSTSWVIQHDMNANPDVSVNIGGVYIPGVDVLYTSLNSLTISFSTPQSGTAILRR